MPTLRNRLREETSAVHEAVEMSGFSRALQEGSLAAFSAVSYLRCLAILHAALERGLGLSTDARVLSVWRQSSPKLPLLLSDLERVSSGHLSSVRPAIHAALAVSSRIVQASLHQPIQLLGYLYVLEGSQNGGMILRKFFSKLFSASGEEGLSYFGCNGNRTREVWNDFVRALDAVELGEPEIPAIIAAARRLFEGMGEIHSALMGAGAEDLVFHVTAFNPEAGNHAMPSDPVKVEVALRAGNRAREAFPYLEARFGERGKRFTASDSCWLLTLIGADHPVVRKNIYWLRSVLASRGLPSVILENHMRELARELEAAIPGRSVGADGFLRVVAELEQDRVRFLSPAALASLVGDQPEIAPEIPLLASAFADEKNGCTGAFEAVRSWLKGAGSHGAQWNERIDRVAARLEAGA